MRTQIGQMVAKILDNFQLKAIGAAGMSVFSFFFDAGHHQALIAVLILIVFDFITAIHAALKTGVAIESAKIFRTAVKVATYFLLVSAAFTAEKTVPLAFLDETVLGFLAMTELISIMENTAKAGFAVPRSLLEKLKSFNQSQ